MCVWGKKLITRILYLLDKDILHSLCTIIGNYVEHVEQEVAQTVYFLLDSSQFDTNEPFIKYPLAFFICNLPWNFQIPSFFVTESSRWSGKFPVLPINQWVYTTCSQNGCIMVNYTSISNLIYWPFSKWYSRTNKFHIRFPFCLLFTLLTIEIFLPGITDCK